MLQQPHQAHSAVAKQNPTEMCEKPGGDRCSVGEAQNGSCEVVWGSLTPHSNTSITDKVMRCQSAFTSQAAYPTACLVNKSFLISVLLFPSPTEFAVVFVPFLFEEGTPTGVLFCWEERVLVCNRLFPFIPEVFQLPTKTMH